MTDNAAHIERLSAGHRPPSPLDGEIERILDGRAPITEEETIVNLSTTSLARRAVSSDWEPPTLTGTRKIKIGKTEFWIPRDAQTKYSRRAATYWVLVGDEVFIFSELGQLRQTSAERRSLRWDLL